MNLEVGRFTVTQQSASGSFVARASYLKPWDELCWEQENLEGSGNDGALRKRRV
jgi:hypothetical protein